MNNRLTCILRSGIATRIYIMESAELMDSTPESPSCSLIMSTTSSDILQPNCLVCHDYYQLTDVCLCSIIIIIIIIIQVYFRP